MNGPVHFEITNRLSELKKIARIVDDFSNDHNLDRRSLYLINLVLDEVVTNIISYGFTDDEEHTIQVGLALESRILTIRVEDDGNPFSIADAPKINVRQPLEERPIGGLGCHLVKKMMDEVSYERRSGKNLLLMRKNIDHIGPISCCSSGYGGTD